MNERKTNRKGTLARTLASAVLLCGAIGVWPAAAQGGDPDSGGGDRRYHGPRSYGGVSPDDGPWSHGRRPEFDRIGREEFERGYRAGRDDERLRGERRGESGRERFTDLGWNDPWQTESRERLERAAARLREALVLMRRQPSGRGRDEALEQARQALVRVQNAMTWLPSEEGAAGGEERRRYERRSGQGIGAERASGGWLS